jgi:outer membrane murein-binding lipoprotein Lpp
MPSTHDPNAVEFVKDYPKQVFSHPPERPPEYLAYLEKAAMALRSLRLLVYAGVAGFTVVAAYGFFLIYLLTGDARTMAEQTQIMTAQMQIMTSQMRTINATMGAMETDIGAMRGDMAVMRANIQDMNAHMAAMDMTTRQMATTVALIQHSARNLDASLGPAMGTMNKFMPFSGGGNSWPGAPPFAPLR